MNHLTKRIEFWSEADKGRTEGGSISHPFMSHLEIFESKDVLEIGPGWGRQFKEINLVSLTYCVADICQEVLNRNIYKNIEKFLIKNHQQDLDRQFDVITFWYVVHHMLKSELDDFFSFLNRHLKVEGRLFFNYPSDTFDTKIGSPENPNGDGIKTTPHGIKRLSKVLDKYNFKVLYEKDMAQNCYVFLAEKIGGST